MKKVIVVSIMVLLGLVLTACGGVTNPASEAPLPATSESAPNAVALTQVSDEAMVTVEVTPLNLADATPTSLDFEIAMNTHSVDLSYDLAKIAVLRSDAGEEVQPVKWDGPTSGGHNVRGRLSFPPLKDRGKSLTLIVRGIADVPERNFTWSVSD